MATTELEEVILNYISELWQSGFGSVSAGLIQQQTGRPRPTVNRALARLVQHGKLIKLGAGRSIKYSLSETFSYQDAAKQPSTKHLKPNTQNLAIPAALTPATSFQWSRPSRKAVKAVSPPLGTRKPITYQLTFINGYSPNKSALLPPALAEELFNAGKSRDQLPAGTYARRVIEQLLIDLSWSSSQLEGNRISLQDTQELFNRRSAELGDKDSVMLLNHKEAIEFLVDTVPMEGITVPVMRNTQSILMRDLLDDPSDLGAIREKFVDTQNTVSISSQPTNLLEDMLTVVVNKTCEVLNPIEAAFFLWVNIAYLQPFLHGNKRTSRLAANMPLLLTNCAPLSFMDIGQQEYLMAMLAIYERRDVTLAAELFAWTYRRSIERYRVVMESMSGPNPLRVRYRGQLGEAVRNIVFHGLTLSQALAQLHVSDKDRDVFLKMLEVELDVLQTYNCARYRLSMSKTADWIKQGRIR